MPLTDFITRIDVSPPKIPVGSQTETGLRQDAGSESATSFSRSLAEQSRRSEPSAPHDVESPAAVEPEAPNVSDRQKQASDTQPKTTEFTEPKSAVEQRPPADGAATNDEQDAEVLAETTLETSLPAADSDIESDHRFPADEEYVAAIPVPQLQPVETPLETEKSAVLTPPSGLQVVNHEAAADSETNTKPPIQQVSLQKPAPPQSFLQTGNAAPFTQTDVTAPETPAVEQIQEATTPTAVPELGETSIDVLPEVDSVVTIDSENQVAIDTTNDSPPAVREPSVPVSTLAASEQIAGNEAADKELPATAIDPLPVEITTDIPNENSNAPADERPVSVDATGRVPAAEVVDEPSETPPAAVVQETPAAHAVKVGSETAVPPAVTVDVEPVETQRVESTATAGSEVEAPSTPSETVPRSESADPQSEVAETLPFHSSSQPVARADNSHTAVQPVLPTAEVDRPADTEGSTASERVESVERIETGANQTTVRVDTANRGTVPAPATGTAAAMPVDLAAPEATDRIAQMVQSSLQTGRPLRVRLNPPELGTLQIEVAVRNGVVTARLDVQNASARQIVLDNLSSLQESLSQNGSTVNTIEVHLSDLTSDDKSADSFADWDQQAESDLSQDLSQDENRHGWESQSVETDEQDSPQRASVQNVDRLDIQV